MLCRESVQAGRQGAYAGAINSREVRLQTEPSPSWRDREGSWGACTTLVQRMAVPAGRKEQDLVQVGHETADHHADSAQHDERHAQRRLIEGGAGLWSTQVPSVSAASPTAIQPRSAVSSCSLDVAKGFLSIKGSRGDKGEAQPRPVSPERSFTRMPFGLFTVDQALEAEARSIRFRPLLPDRCIAVLARRPHPCSWHDVFDRDRSAGLGRERDHHGQGGPSPLVEIVFAP